MAAAVRQVMDTLGLGEVQAQILVANCDGNAEAAVMNFLENGAEATLGAAANLSGNFAEDDPSLGSGGPVTAGQVSQMQREMVIQSTGHKLQVRLGDLTCEPVDAIVNPANKMLQHAGGLAEAIVKVGGAVIQKDSKTWLDTYGEVNKHGHREMREGQCMSTTAGALPCRMVVHTVGPTWSGGPRTEANPTAAVLEEAVRNSLDKAEHLKV